MRGAAAPCTPRLKRKDTLHAYRVAAKATDLRITVGMTRQVHAKNGPLGGLDAHIARAQCTHQVRPSYFLGPLWDPFEVGDNPAGVGLDLAGPNLAGQRRATHLRHPKFGDVFSRK